MIIRFIKNTGLIFWSDIKGIAKNWVAIIIVLGLALIPSLYAWINILASTDPYGATGNIAIAVVSLDEGGQLLGKKVNIGDQVLENLKDNTQLGWQFYEDEQNAIHDTEVGKIYAAIIIPKDFSAKVCTMLDSPQQPSLEYYVNMKKNAIAPKMTGAGAAALQSQIKASLIDEVVNELYSVLNEVGINLDDQYDKIENFLAFLYELEPELPALSEKAQVVQDSAGDALDNVLAQRKNIERISDMLLSASDITGTLGGDLEKLDQKIQEKEAPVFDILETTKDASLKVAATTEKIMDLNDKLIEILPFLEKFKKDPSESKLVKLHDMSQEIFLLARDVSLDLDREILPLVHDYLNKGADLSDEADWAASYGQEEMQKVLALLNEIDEKGNAFLEKSQSFIDAWPQTAEKINAVIDKVEAIDEEVDLKQAIRLMKRNGAEEGDFFANPVGINTHELFPVENYGAGMTPFYTTLCLWVGALILCALLTTSAKNVEFTCTPKQVFFGKWLLFVFLGILQGLFVALGDLYLLKIHMEEPLLFVLLSMFYSVVFITMVYTFVAQLGNVGKALGVILLVLQIAGSGGTFPIEVTPQYFQNLYSVLPFTYAISGMREAVAGVVPENLRQDITVLLTYLCAFILFGLISKHWIQKVTHKFNKKLAQSGITEH